MSKGFDVHSINNYLDYPPARNDISQHLKEVQEKLNLSIIKSKNFNISCNNVESFLWENIRPTGEATSEMVSVLGVEQKFRFGDYFLIIKKNDHEYKIETKIAGEWYPWIFGTILALLLFKNPQALANMIQGFGHIVQDQTRRMRKEEEEDQNKQV